MKIKYLLSTALLAGVLHFRRLLPKTGQKKMLPKQPNPQISSERILNASGWIFLARTSAMPTLTKIRRSPS